MESPEKQRLRTLLLNGPVMVDEQFIEYQNIRHWMNQWALEAMPDAPVCAWESLLEEEVALTEENVDWLGFS